MRRNKSSPPAFDQSTSSAASVDGEDLPTHGHHVVETLCVCNVAELGRERQAHRMPPVAEPAGNREERQKIPQRTAGTQDDDAHWFTTAKSASASCCSAASSERAENTTDGEG